MAVVQVGEMTSPWTLLIENGKKTYLRAIIYETKWTEFGDELDMAYEKWRNIKECSLEQLI